MWFNLHLSTLALTAALVPVGCTGTGSFVDTAPWRDSAPPPFSASPIRPATRSASNDPSASDEDLTLVGSTDPLDQSSESFLALADTAAAPEPLSTKTADAPSGNPPDESPSFEKLSAPLAERNLSEHDLNAETLRLMEDYLSQVPFQERRRLYQKWKTLEAEEIRRRIAERESQRMASDAVAQSNGPAEMDLAIEDQNDEAVSDKNIMPAAFDVPVEPKADRPVPLMERLISRGAEAPPELKPVGQSQWDKQLQLLLAAARSRAETARARYLKAKGQVSGTEDKITEEAKVHSLRRNYIASQVDLRLLYLMSGERGRALQAIPEIPAADQEFWRGVLWSIASYFDAEAMPRKSDRMTQTVERLRIAINKLQGEANLKLRNVAFCRKITSFGNFERFDQNTYAPGQKVLLYAEIINFESVPRTTDGLYETRLASTIEILREGEGKPLQRIAFEPTVDLCRSYRQDYFHSYELKLPADLPAGPYVLKLTIEDIQSGDVAVYSLNFAVGNRLAE